MLDTEDTSKLIYNSISAEDEENVNQRKEEVSLFVTVFPEMCENVWKKIVSMRAHNENLKTYKNIA